MFEVINLIMYVSKGKKNELTWNVKFNDRSEISLGISRPYENIFLILFYSHDNRQHN